jgi:hypothetical protein
MKMVNADSGHGIFVRAKDFLKSYASGEDFCSVRTAGDLAAWRTAALAVGRCDQNSPGLTSSAVESCCAASGLLAAINSTLVAAATIATRAALPHRCDQRRIPPD